MNYDTMEAGPEMDRLIVTQVMGWRVAEHFVHYKALGAYQRGPAIFRGDEMYCWDGCWHPSAEISAAWEVVERMQQQGFGFTLDNDCERLAYRAAFGDAGFDFTSAEADTMPHAIAIAALKSTHKEH